MKKFQKIIPIILICSLLIAHCSLLIAQPQALKMEFATKSNTDNYNIIPIAEKGLLVFYQERLSHSSVNQWLFSKYDTIFKLLWNKDISISRSLRCVKYHYDAKSDKLYILFTEIKGSLQSDIVVPDNSGFVILSIDIMNGEYKLTKGNIPARMTLNDFKVIGTQAFIGGNSWAPSGMVYLHSFLSLTFIPLFSGLSFYTFKPVLLNVDISSGKLALVPFASSGNSYFLNQQENTVSNQHSLTVIEKNNVSTKKAFLCFNTVNTDGSISRADRIPLPRDSTVVSARLFKIGDDNFLTGTYKYLRRHYLRFSPFNNAASELSLTSDGIFISRINNNKPAQPDFFRFYSFSNFQTINQQLSGRKTKASKRKFRLDYQLLLHDIVQHGNEYVFIAEAYYPEYHQEYFWTTDPYGRFYRESRQVFDGYRYTHAIVTAFDQKGNLLWDNSFEIGNILTFNLKERVRLLFDGDDMVLVYSNEGKIISKIIHKNIVIQAKEEAPIDNPNSNSNSNSNPNSNLNPNPNPNPNPFKDYISSDIDFWYKNYFITFGYKKLGNDESDRSISGMIFFFNKIAFQ